MPLGGLPQDVALDNSRPAESQLFSEGEVRALRKWATAPSVVESPKNLIIDKLESGGLGMATGPQNLAPQEEWLNRKPIDSLYANKKMIGNKPFGIKSWMLGNLIITTEKLADSSITTVKIADLAVTTPKLADGAVTTIKILDGNVTAPKLASGILFSDASYTPTWKANTTLPSLGNGTITGKYEVCDTHVRLSIKLTIGTTTTLGTGGWYFELPVNCDGANGPYHGAGGTSVGGTVRPMTVVTSGSSSVYPVSVSGFVNSVLPGAWANGDTLEFSILYPR